MTTDTLLYAAQLGLETNPPSTPESACAIFASNGVGHRAAARELRKAIRDLRQTRLAYYLAHPDILIGLSEGRLNTPHQLVQALTNLEATDTGD